VSVSRTSEEPTNSRKQTSSCERNSVLDDQKILWYICRVHKSLKFSHSWAIRIKFTPPHSVYLRAILVLSLYLRLYLSNGLFPSRFGAKTGVHITSPPPVPHDFIQMMYCTWIQFLSSQDRIVRYKLQPCYAARWNNRSAMGRILRNVNAVCWVERWYI
jgi:hypothetical protein